MPLPPIRPIPSRGALPDWILLAVKASDALQAIAAMPAASQSGAAGNGFIDGRVVAGIEFIQSEKVNERNLRAAWKKRRGNGATPLILFTDSDESDNELILLGPNSADEPLRFVRTDSFVDVVAQISGLPELRAVRTLASEMRTLDSSGTAGLSVNGIGTEHLFRRRLRAGSEWADLENSIDGFAGGDWRDLIKHLGYELRQRPDRGYLALSDSRPTLVIHPTKDPGDFSRLNDDGSLREGALLTDCSEENVTCGLLASGGRIRVFLTSDEGGALTRYLQMDIDSLADEDRPLLGLLAHDFVLDGGFDRIIQEARDYGSKLRERLDQSLRQEILPVLGRELGRQAAAERQDLNDDKVREGLEGACLTFVFRALFLLYAESAGYLPMAHEAYRSRSLTTLCERATTEMAVPSESATTYWDDLTSIIHAMRSGKSAWGVPAYNGELFAADGLLGSRLLEKFSVSDSALAPALAALGRDAEAGEEVGLDYSGLEIGHLGHIYEGLLSLRLAVAEGDLTYAPREDRYRPTPEGSEADVLEGDLTWLTHEGGRKGGGVYYTPARLVRHLIRGSVRPAFVEHLEKVKGLIEKDPDRAADELFEFHVVDPACGSAHFLVQVADELADQVAKLLGTTPMPAIRKELESLRGTAGKTYDLEIEDAALLKRLVLKRCVFGVDLSVMGTEIAKLSLWLAGFVPGLSLAYLDRNIVQGNSLVGVIDPEEVAVSDEKHGSLNMFGGALSEDLRKASRTADELQRIPDRTPEEIRRSKDKNLEYKQEVAGAERLMNIWTASFLGHPEARDRALQNGQSILAGDDSLEDEVFVAAARGQAALHWPTAFAETFSRRNPGFDVVVGNPPWEEVTVEELAFYARYSPGLRGLAAGPRAELLAALKAERPELETELKLDQTRTAELRSYLSAQAPGAISAGDPDLYKYFAHRYQKLLRDKGRLGVVLPRTAFLADGMVGFRRWLLEEGAPERIDFVLNRGKWAFDAEERMTVALVTASNTTARGPIQVAGTAGSPQEFDVQSQGDSHGLALRELGPKLEIPLASGPDGYELAARMGGLPFALGGGAWKCFPVRELDETNHRHFWRDKTEGLPLWKGGSFDQYEPAGRESRLCPVSEELLAKVHKDGGRPGSSSLACEGISVEARRSAVARTVGRARLAFRDVSRARDSRTVRACLVPPGTLLVNSAPYLTFLEDDPIQEAACLAVMNSVPFDWQSRRYVESHVSFFVLELLRIPEITDELLIELGRRAAMITAVDDRFTDFADACGVEVGTLEPEEGMRLRAEIDALVAKAWDLDADDLKLMFEDFPVTEAGVSDTYRREILDAFESLGG
jgi:hypothetical protein